MIKTRKKKKKGFSCLNPGKKKGPKGEGFSPATGRKVPVHNAKHEKKRERNLFMFWPREKKEDVAENPYNGGICHAGGPKKRGKDPKHFQYEGGEKREEERGLSIVEKGKLPQTDKEEREEHSHQKWKKRIPRFVFLSEKRHVREEKKSPHFPCKKEKKEKEWTGPG